MKKLDFNFKIEDKTKFDKKYEIVITDKNNLNTYKTEINLDGRMNILDLSTVLRSLADSIEKYSK